MFERFLERVEKSGFFETSVPLHVARAPGRLDVMGGISDYSGALVLQRPIAEATFAAIQISDDRDIEIISDPGRSLTIGIPELSRSYDEARALFADGDANRWAAYVAGVLVVLKHECGLRLSTGARIFISSDVPESKGVASSAALEVAVMQAACAAFDIKLQPVQMAILCQKAENLVAGAPCGVMDQMTSVCGARDSLLALLCQPAELQPPVRIPEGVQFWGIDSGERHAVSGSDYTSVRTGAFMGHRMIVEQAPHTGAYLANVPVEEFEREFAHRLPDEMGGADFLSRYGRTFDTVTKVDPVRIYKVRKPAAHPIYEHRRTGEFRALLAGSFGEAERKRLGELMLESHASYSACGLGSRGTDIIVNLVRAAGPHKGLCGARITGGGSGGTVAVVGRPDAESTIAEIARTYEAMTGHRPYVFSGSSPGACSYKESLR
ncbi:MAG TPA: galactokinase family protein [Terriglobia bacterium]|nr:galactokinase family protein [Terriglobia bacterium]